MNMYLLTYYFPLTTEIKLEDLSRSALNGIERYGHKIKKLTNYPMGYNINQVINLHENMLVRFKPIAVMEIGYFIRLFHTYTRI